MSSQPQSPLTGAKTCCRMIWNYLTEKIDDPKAEKSAEKRANAILVAASVIAAMNYQGSISPPGGAFQLQDNGTVNGTIFVLPGQAVAALIAPVQYRQFTIANAISFSLSMNTMFLFISGLSLKRRLFSFIVTASMMATITATTWSFVRAIQATTPAHDPRLEIGFVYYKGVHGLVTWALVIWFIIAIIIFAAKVWKPLKTLYLRCRCDCV